MNRRIGLLSLVFAAQLVVIGLLLLRQDGAGAGSDRLLDFDAATVSGIRITERGSQAQALQLDRDATGWRSNGLPVDSQRVEQLLERLASLDSPWPVATTTTAAERFQVTDDGYAKYVELQADSQPLAALLLGTSPGFKRIHVRRPNDEAIFSVALTSLDLPVSADDWLDKGLLGNRLAVTRIARVDHWEAVRGADAEVSWSLRGLDSPASASGVSADSKAVAALIERFNTLQVIGVSGAVGSMIDTFELDGDEGSRRYTLFHDVETDVFSLSRDDIEGRFLVAGYLAEQLRADLGNLVQATAVPAAQDSLDDVSGVSGD